MYIAQNSSEHMCIIEKDLQFVARLTLGSNSCFSLFIQSTASLDLEW